MNKTGLCSAVIAMLFLMACHAPEQSPVDQAKQQGSIHKMDINDVLRAHDQELMAIPGVVGVYVGLLPDDKTPCLIVMVVKETKDLRKKIPGSIEGYPVLLEESGIIRPLAPKFQS
jgi:hypothetical protein